MMGGGVNLWWWRVGFGFGSSARQAALVHALRGGDVSLCVAWGARSWVWSWR